MDEQQPLNEQITLRDIFAAFALIALAQREGTTQENDCIIAYEYADTMLEQRNVR